MELPAVIPILYSTVEAHLVIEGGKPGLGLGVDTLVGPGLGHGHVALVAGPFFQARAVLGRGPSFTLGGRGGGGFVNPEDCLPDPLYSAIPWIVGLGELGHTWSLHGEGTHVGGQVRMIPGELGVARFLPGPAASDPRAVWRVLLGVEMPVCQW